jgi:hypothetical protein
VSDEPAFFENGHTKPRSVAFYTPRARGDRAAVTAQPNRLTNPSRQCTADPSWPGLCRRRPRQRAAETNPARRPTG